MNTLHFRYDVNEYDSLTLRPVVDGNDLLALHQNPVGAGPDTLLPPLSAALLPTTAGAVALIGLCTCGESGCGSLTILVTRSGDRVIWSPDERAVHETIAGSYSFELRQYLDAVDAAAGDPPRGEGQGRRVARAVRVRRREWEQIWGTTGHRAIDWVSAWPWTSDTVRVSYTIRGEQHVTDLAPTAGESDASFTARVFDGLRATEMSAHVALTNRSFENPTGDG